MSVKQLFSVFVVALITSGLMIASGCASSAKSTTGGSFGERTAKFHPGQHYHGLEWAPSHYRQ